MGNEEERRAIEEAYTANIERMGEEDVERNPANSLHLIHSYSRLLEIMLQDYEQRHNEEEQYIETSEFRQSGDSLEDYSGMGDYIEDYMEDYTESRQYMDSNQIRNKEYS